MKKFLAGAIAAVAMSGGLVATTSATSEAAPYPGSVRTYCHSWNVGKAHPNNTRAYFSASGRGGIPHGRVYFTYTQNNGAHVYKFNKYFPGDEKVYTFEGIHRGGYQVKVYFDSRPKGSVFKNCSTSFSVRVR